MSDAVGRIIPVERRSTKEVIQTIVQDTATIYRLRQELRNCRNELCLKCGNYHESYAGACDGCRYRRGGEWEADLNA